MNAGTFWCWRVFPNPRACNKDDVGVWIHDEPPIRTSRGEARWSSDMPPRGRITDSLFTDIFGEGAAPKPGEALLLDAKDWPSHCPECGIAMDNDGVMLHPLCGHDADGPYPEHARIITRKTLEEGT